MHLAIDPVDHRRAAEGATVAAAAASRAADAIDDGAYPVAVDQLETALAQTAAAIVLLREEPTLRELQLALAGYVADRDEPARSRLRAALEARHRALGLDPADNPYTAGP